MGFPIHAILMWLGQQSTQKAIVALLAALGMQFDILSLEQATTGFLAFYSLIAGIRDKN
jgi:hypothetical protein